MVLTWLEAFQYNSYIFNPATRGMVQRIIKYPSLCFFNILESPPASNEAESNYWAFICHQFWLIFSSSYRNDFVSTIQKIHFSSKELLIKLRYQIKTIRRIERLEGEYGVSKKFIKGYSYFGKISLLFAFHRQFHSQHVEKIRQTQNSLNTLLGKRISLEEIPTELKTRKEQLKETCTKVQNLRLYIPRPEMSAVASKIHGIIVPDAKNQALKDISHRIHPEMKQVWQKMFDKFDPKTFTGWSCNSNTGEFMLTLSQPLKMWVPSTDEHGVEDPKGGIVLMLGDDKNRVYGTLDKESKVMNFSDGFYVRCKYSIPALGYIFVTPNVNRLTYHSKERVTFGAGLRLPGIAMNRDRDKTIKYLLENWSDRGIVVDNPDEFITSKLQRT